MKYFTSYLVLVNFIAFLLFLVDKKKAQNNKWRIPEARLLFFALIGGSLGGILGMKIFRHKTKTPKFTIGMPVLLIINIICLFYISKIW